MYMRCHSVDSSIPHDAIIVEKVEAEMSQTEYRSQWFLYLILTGQILHVIRSYFYVDCS